MDQEPEFRPYVNLPPMTKNRSNTHLTPIPDHNRSVSCEDSIATSSSSDSGVRTRSQDTQMTQLSDFESPNKNFVVAYEYTAQKEDEIDLPLGLTFDIVNLEKCEEGWYRGELNGKFGYFPSNYVRCIEGNQELTEFSGDEIQLPDPRKTLDDFQIGYGATATVFKVEIKWFKRDAKGNKILSEWNMKKAALKRFNYHAQRGDNTITPFDMLKREANLVNGLKHPNIVRLLGVCMEIPYYGLLLELCEGSSLRTVLHKINTEKTIRVLINWGKQIASGMEYLIKQGYIHRDLKSDNVLVKEEVCICVGEESMSYEWCPKCGRRPLNRLQLKITDFGVTRKVTADANRLSAVGTYAWLAPEAFRDNAYSEASDVWSFGVVMWELLSGEEPYQGMIPTAIAYQIVKQGQSLTISKSCPEKWRIIMQSCWELESKDRPTFRELVTSFVDYEKEAESGLLDGELDHQLKRVQSTMKDIYTKCAADNKTQLENLFNNLYSTIGRRNHGSIAPQTKARHRQHKGKKPQISAPVGDVKHILSVQREKGSDTNLKFYYNEQNLEGGTLPRSNGNVKPGSLSASSPDLVQLYDIQNGSNTIGHSAAPRISRQKAIRKKHPRGNMYGETPLVTPTNDCDSLTNFAKIDSAEDDVAKEQKKDGTLSRVFSKFPWVHGKRDSKDDEERCGSISSRSSSTTSSHRHLPPGYSGQTTRGAASSLFLDASARTRAASAVDFYDDSKMPSPRNKVSPSDKSRPVKHTNLTERFVKDDLARPALLHGRPRKSVLDQPIPASPNSPEQNHCIPMPVSMSRRTTTTSSTDGPNDYESISSQNTPNQPHNRNHVMHPSLSTYIPVGANEPTHYQMHNGTIGGAAVYYYPIGGGCDDYIPVDAPQETSSIGEINNTPYVELSRPFAARNVQNPQYYHCKPTKPPPTRSSPKIIYPNGTLENKRTGNHYSINEPPDHQAPPPPPFRMSPPTRLAPVIPPRDGSVALNSTEA